MYFFFPKKESLYALCEHMRADPGDIHGPSCGQGFAQPLKWDLQKWECLGKVLYIAFISIVRHIRTESTAACPFRCKKRVK